MLSRKITSRLLDKSGFAESDDCVEFLLDYIKNTRELIITEKELHLAIIVIYLTYAKRHSADKQFDQMIFSIFGENIRHILSTGVDKNAMKIASSVLELDSTLYQELWSNTRISAIVAIIYTMNAIQFASPTEVNKEKISQLTESLSITSKHLYIDTLMKSLYDSIEKFNKRIIGIK